MSNYSFDGPTSAPCPYCGQDHRPQQCPSFLGSFGHPSWEEGPPPTLCPSCGEYHESEECPYDQEPDSSIDARAPEDPSHAEVPLWMLGIDSPTVVELAADSYRQVCDRSQN